MREQLLGYNKAHHSTIVYTNSCVISIFSNLSIFRQYIVVQTKIFCLCLLFFIVLGSFKMTSLKFHRLSKGRLFPNLESTRGRFLSDTASVGGHVLDANRIQIPWLHESSVNSLRTSTVEQRSLCDRVIHQSKNKACRPM